MRRRALLAAYATSDGDMKWAYELHFTPEWESIFFGWQAEIDGDFNELHELLWKMINTLGYTDDTLTVIEVNEIPEECNVTVDGNRLSSIYAYKGSYTAIELTFGDYYCYGILSPTHLSLDK